MATGFRPFNPRKFQEERTPINEQIRFPSVRVVSERGEQLGIMSSQEAFAKAQEMKNDLVLITDKADPPVCKIIDYGKFCYEREKQKKEAKKKQKVVHIKELKIKHTIGAHDLEIKINHIIEFLKEKDKVKIMMLFTGRSRGYIELGQIIMKTIIEKTEPHAIIERGPVLDGATLFLMLAPKK